MSISIGRGKYQQNSILYPAEKGLNMVAKNRIQQAVGMQNERHIEALKVDGVDLQVWTKNYSGQLCSCGLAHNGEDSNNILDSTGVNSVQESLDPFTDMEVEEDWENWEDKKDSNEWERNYSNYKDYKTQDEITEDLIERYAENSDTSLLYGGDKTPCGICYGTGYKEGYQLYNGKRYVLDYFDKPEVFGFLAEQTYPISFKSKYDSSSYIIWKFKAPTFFKKYLGLRVRNNVSICKNYTLEISFDGINYIKYEDSVVEARNRQQTDIYLKVIPYSLDSTEDFSITHIEVFYQLGDFIKGDFAPIAKTENFELFEALQTTSLELAGDVAYLDRESVIGEPKTGNVWKVTSLTPHMTSDRQIFKNELELRMIQNSENLYLLNLINKPYLILNHRGLEQKQDMLTYNGNNSEEYK